jgi:hypothetical protein
MKYIKEGNQLCIIKEDFINLQESDALFIDLDNPITKELMILIDKPATLCNVCLEEKSGGLNMAETRHEKAMKGFLTWLKNEEQFTGEEIDLFKEIVNEIMDIFLRICTECGE